MIIGMQGSRNFNDYAIFLNAMTRIMNIAKEEKEIVFMTAGPHRVNDMLMEFTNVSERSLKARGIKVKVVKMPSVALKERIHDIDYLVYLCLPKEPVSDLIREAQNKDAEVAVYRYA